MPTISLDYIDDIINTCKDGNLLITYYRNHDVGLERIEDERERAIRESIRSWRAKRS